MTNIILLGAPGSGKGTQAQRIYAAYALPQISTGDLLSDAYRDGTYLGLRAQEYRSRGELVPDEITNQLAFESLSRADCRDGFVLDGYPRTVDQARVLDQFLNSNGKSLDAVISIHCPDDLLIARVTSRRICKECKIVYGLEVRPKKEDVCDCNGELYRRKDDNPDIFRARLPVYYSKTFPLIELYQQRSGIFHQVDGTVSVDAIFAVISKIIGKDQRTA